MLVAALDGRHIEVRRRWLPWKPKMGAYDAGIINVTDAADDVVSALALIVLSVVLTIAAAVVLTIVLFAGEILLLALLIIPILGIARIFWILPWVVEATYGIEVLGTEQVRGWRRSGDRIEAISQAYQQGQDPFTKAGPHAG